MKRNQVTPSRTGRRRKEKPLSVAEALHHLTARATLMHAKRPEVWLRWNRADIEAVEAIVAAIATKTRVAAATAPEK
jgi:hypothetical protein